MLWTIVLVLIALWAFGLFGGFVMGGAIHLLLVLALIVVALRVFTGRRLV